MRNRHEVKRLCAEHGIPVERELKAWDKGGKLVVLRIDRPLHELVEELRARGAL